MKSHRIAETTNVYNEGENQIGVVTMTVTTQIIQPVIKGSETIGQTIDFMISEFYAGNPEGKLTELHLELNA